jgi:hypothetical protein
LSARSILVVGGEKKRERKRERKKKKKEKERVRLYDKTQMTV